MKMTIVVLAELANYKGGRQKSSNNSCVFRSGSWGFGSDERKKLIIWLWKESAKQSKEYGKANLTLNMKIN